MSVYVNTVFYIRSVSPLCSNLKMSENESDRIEKMAADSTERKVLVEELQQVEENLQDRPIATESQVIVGDGPKEDVSLLKETLGNTSELEVKMPNLLGGATTSDDGTSPIGISNALVPLPYSTSSGQLLSANFPGPLKFDLVFPDRINHKTPSVYMSTLLNKVYIRMKTTIAIQFRLDRTNVPTEDLYVRATAKYCSLDAVQIPVERCRLHKLDDDPLNKSHEFLHLCKCSYYNLAGHVLRSASNEAIYCYDPASRRHSVMNPLKNYSNDLVYSFHCKSSCPNGIERRPIHVIFTLEKLNGAVLGQTSLDFKICTSPKRDRERNEAEFNKLKTPKRKADAVLGQEPVEEPSKRIDTKLNAKMHNALVAMRYYLQRADEQCRAITHLLEDYKQM